MTVNVWLKTHGKWEQRKNWHCCGPNESTIMGSWERVYIPQEKSREKFPSVFLRGIEFFVSLSWLFFSSKTPVLFVLSAILRLIQLYRTFFSAKRKKCVMQNLLSETWHIALTKFQVFLSISLSMLSLLNLWKTEKYFL